MQGNFYLGIKKIIPEFFKKYFRRIYFRFSIKMDENIISFLRQYYNLSERNVFRLLKSAGQLSAGFWSCLNPKTEIEIIKFYEDNPFYVFALIFWHGTKYQRDLRSNFLKLSKGRVLDYGGGVGDLCYNLSKNGVRVDYADLQGKTFDFAASFFKKVDINIKMINLSKEKISENYDTIFCIDVIEHVKNPKELIKVLVSRLNLRGQLIITALEPNISEDTPMHFKIKFDPEEYLNSLGMEKSKKEFLWIKKYECLR